MEALLFTPPVAFVIILTACFLLSKLFARCACRTKKREHGKEPYACGEEKYDHMAQPDYSTFFPFAFFFTIAHVATLIMTTVPVAGISTYFLALLYIIGAATGLYILIRD